MKPASFASRTSFALSALLLVSAGALPGCHFWNRLWGKDSVDLSKADVQSMSVDIRKDRKTICPREQVQMAVFADIVPEGEKDKKSVETWAGRGSVNKNDKMDFVDFAFHSEQGAFDETGWFAPDHNLLSTTDKEFEIKTVFKRRPDKFSFTTKYKPDYQCIKGGGKGGQAGAEGSGGSGGSGGNGMTPSGSTVQAQSGQRGGDGPGGASGSGGQKGPDGHAQSHAGQVSDQFGSLSGVTLLDAAPAPAADAPPPTDTGKAGKGKPGGAKKKTGGGS
jgi:hypothetical protein